MTALLATGDRAIPVANDVGLRSPYRATVHELPPAAPVVFHQNGDTETMVLVEEGVIELSIAGAEGYLSEGEFARVAPGIPYAYRNCGDRPARLLSVPVIRTEHAPSAATIIVETAAA